MEFWEKFIKKDRRSSLQKEIDRLYELMEQVDPLSDEYEKIQTRYCTLMEQKLKQKSKLPSADTVVNAGVTIVGLLSILHYEQLHVIASKAFQAISHRIGRT